MKQWQNFQALGKVKVCIEQQLRELALTLESSLDMEHPGQLSSEDQAACVASLADVAGVLHMLECTGIALLAEEIQGLLEDTAALSAARDGQRITEMHQLAFVALTDFPVIVDGVLSGRIQHWHEFSQLFNRVRKARNRGLIFSSETLFSKRQVNFRKLFSSKPDQMKVLLNQQLQRYNGIKKALHDSTDNAAASVRQLHGIFSSLEVMCRDFRLGTLWSLCAAIAEVVPDAQADYGNPAIKLLCSFTGIMQLVRDRGGRTLEQNIPDDILEKLMEALNRLPTATGRLHAIKYWFNLDFALVKAWRESNLELLVRYNRKDAFAKAIKLLIERTGQLSNAINEAIETDEHTAEQAVTFTRDLQVLRASLAAMGMEAPAALLSGCVDWDPDVTDSEDSMQGVAVEYLDRCAQVLYQCELALQRQAEELDRAVFVSSAGKQDDTPLGGAKLGVVLEAIKNLEQVVVAINNYAEADCDASKLHDAGRLLRGAGAALTTVRVASVADYCTGAADFVETKLVDGTRPDQQPGLSDATHALAHLVITSIQYLEQLSTGRTENCARLDQACNIYLKSLQPEIDPDVSSDTASMPAGSNTNSATESVRDEAVFNSTSAGTVVVEDDEIYAVFIEEAAELLLRINDCHETLADHLDDADALTELRRNYHTLKGSGRMVGAEAVAALAWSVENLLNNIIGGRLPFAAEMRDKLVQIRDRLPALIADFQARQPSSLDPATVADDVAVIDSLFVSGAPAALVKPEAVSADATMTEDATPPDHQQAAGLDAVQEAGVNAELSVEQPVDHEGEWKVEQEPEQDQGLDQPVDPQPPEESAVPDFRHISTQTAPEADEAATNTVNADLVNASAESPAESVPAPTANESLLEIFGVEAARRISSIRRYLDGTVSVDADGMAITSTSYLIPVHTLYGNCRVAELQQFCAVVGQLERLLQDYPYRPINNALHALLTSFCDVTAQVTANFSQDAGFSPSAELQQQIDIFLLSLADVRSELAGTGMIQDGEDEISPVTQDDATIPAASEEALALAGFLQEARTLHAHIRNLYLSFRANNSYEREVAARLHEQFALFDGAASVAKQAAIAPVCRELARAYRQYADGQYAISETVINRFDRCHGYIADCLNSLEKGRVVNDLANNLQVELTSAIGQLVSLRQETNIQVAEEQVEESLLAVFLEEAGEILHELDSKIADWQQAPDDKTIIDDLLRSLHTLKGSAALVGEKDLSECAHRFETCVIDSGNARLSGANQFFAKVDRYLNVLQVLFALYYTDERGRLARRPIADAELATLMQVDVVSVQVDASDDKRVEQAEPERTGELSQVAAGTVAAGDAATDDDVRRVPSRKGIAASASASHGAAGDEHVRVSANLLKGLLNDADEISIARNRVEQTIADVNLLMGDMEETLERFENAIGNFEHYAKTGAGIRREDAGDNAPEHSTGQDDKDFDALEMDKYTELQQIVLSMLEDYNDVMDIKNNVSAKIRTMGATLMEQQRSTNKLQEGLVSSQMVPFAGIAPRLRRLVRQVGLELGKQVTISFGNPEGKIDRSVLQALVNPVEHMIRNALDHGIEPTKERLASGKQGQGELQVRLYRQGASVILDIADDGRGIDTAKVRKKAIAQGLLAAEQEVTEQELCQLILRAGFSTSDTVSHISGRGVGLDVVQDEISQIGGDLEIVSTPGRGTTFRIRLPLTSSLNRALLFRVSGAEYVMLLNTIDGIILDKNATLQRCYDEGMPAIYQYGDKSYELAWLGALLDDRAVPEFQGGNDASSSLVLVSGEGKNLALHVDAVVGSRELLVKSLGVQFASIPVLTGGVILGDGRVVVVLDPRFLVDSHVANKSAAARLDFPARGEAQADQFETGKTVMVVDDSITVRKVTSAILKRNGMNVILAKNGVEAVELLQSTRPDIMLLDIEMPKMDGFEVAAYVRRQESSIKNLPIIMITSRIGEKHRSRAEEIGVNQYMCKPFQENNLLDAIAEYS